MSYGRYRSLAYQPGQKTSYKISRSKIELYMQCPRCFWLDARLRIKRPSSPPFQINKAIDELLKKEFDGYRKKSKPHPIMIENHIDAVPMQHKELDKWRYNFTGVVYLHKATNFHVFGAVDDLWIDNEGQVIVVDYKATAKKKEVSIDADWQIVYKRQMEIYQWLLKQNGFTVNNIGYFVYANGRTDLDKFGDRVEFRTKLISYEGNSDWVDKALEDIKSCLEGDIPKVGIAIMGGICEHCSYARSRTELTLKALRQKNK